MFEKNVNEPILLSTGDPKAALDSHKGVVNNTYFIGKRMTFHEGRHNICVQVGTYVHQVRSQKSTYVFKY